MTALVTEVVEALDAIGVPTALIGAAALALRGVPRSSDDTDLLVIGEDALTDAPWARLKASGTVADVRRGDANDPLAGVVRLVRGTEQVDVVALRGASWQRALLVDASPMKFADGTLLVCTARGLVLLKLYAGGYHDRQDVLALLALHGEPLRAEIDARIEALPPDAIALWQELRASA